jgi:hypothetical protein
MNIVTRRHPCEVTSDRLSDHIERYHDLLTGAERDEFSHVRHVLESIADGTIEEED